MLLVERSPQFKDDLRSVAEFIAEHNVASSMRFLNSVEETARHLSICPISGTVCRFRHPIVEGLRMITVRRFRNYLIYFRLLDDRVELVRLVHGARQQQGIFEKPKE